MRKIAYMNAFLRRRYSRGDGINFYKDIIWYVDGLLKEAGLRSQREGRRWWEDGDKPFVLSDLEDYSPEFLARYEGSERKA